MRFVLARETGDRATLSRVLTNARRLAERQRRGARTGAAERELMGLADELDDPGLRAEPRSGASETLVEEGHGARLEDLIDLASANTGQLRMGSYHHSLAYTQAVAGVAARSHDEADLLVERAAAIGRHSASRR